MLPWVWKSLFPTVGTDLTWSHYPLTRNWYNHCILQMAGVYVSKSALGHTQRLLREFLLSCSTPSNWVQSFDGREISVIGSRSEFSILDISATSWRLPRFTSGLYIVGALLKVTVFHFLMRLVLFIIHKHRFIRWFITHRAEMAL